MSQRRAAGARDPLLQLRVQINGGSNVINHVAEQVVPTGAVATAAANKGVVAEAVEHTIATRAFIVLLTEGHPQPPLQHSTVQRGFVTKLRFGGRGSLEP